MKPEIRAILERDLSMVWNVSNIREASDTVQVCNDNFGGLRSGQLLFTSDPSQDVFVCGAWWPWGDGETISLRIASPAKELQHEKKTGLFNRLKDLFGL